MIMEEIPANAVVAGGAEYEKVVEEVLAEPEATDTAVPEEDLPPLTLHFILYFWTLTQQLLIARTLYTLCLPLERRLD